MNELFSWRWPPDIIQPINPYHHPDHVHISFSLELLVSNRDTTHLISTSNDSDLWSDDRCKWSSWWPVFLFEYSDFLSLLDIFITSDIRYIVVYGLDTLLQDSLAMIGKRWLNECAWWNERIMTWSVIKSTTVNDRNMKHAKHSSILHQIFMTNTYRLNIHIL